MKMNNKDQLEEFCWICSCGLENSLIIFICKCGCTQQNIVFPN